MISPLGLDASAGCASGIIARRSLRVISFAVKVQRSRLGCATVSPLNSFGFFMAWHPL
jgi:hypothetical protein